MKGLYEEEYSRASVKLRVRCISSPVIVCTSGGKESGCLEVEFAPSNERNKEETLEALDSFRRNPPAWADRLRYNAVFALI